MILLSRPKSLSSRFLCRPLSVPIKRQICLFRLIKSLWLSTDLGHKSNIPVSEWLLHRCSILTYLSCQMVVGCFHWYCLWIRRHRDSLDPDLWDFTVEILKFYTICMQMHLMCWQRPLAGLFTWIPGYNFSAPDFLKWKCLEYELGTGVQVRHSCVQIIVCTTMHRSQGLLVPGTSEYLVLHIIFGSFYSRSIVPFLIDETQSWLQSVYMLVFREVHPCLKLASYRVDWLICEKTTRYSLHK